MSLAFLYPNQAISKLQKLFWWSNRFSLMWNKHIDVQRTYLMLSTHDVLPFIFPPHFDSHVSASLFHVYIELKQKKNMNFNQQYVGMRIVNTTKWYTYLRPYVFWYNKEWHCTYHLTFNALNLRTSTIAVVRIHPMVTNAFALLFTHIFFFAHRTVYEFSVLFAEHFFAPHFHIVAIEFSTQELFIYFASVHFPRFICFYWWGFQNEFRNINLMV